MDKILKLSQFLQVVLVANDYQMCIVIILIFCNRKEKVLKCFPDRGFGWEVKKSAF